MGQRVEGLKSFEYNNQDEDTSPSISVSNKRFIVLITGLVENFTIYLRN